MVPLRTQSTGEASEIPRANRGPQRVCSDIGREQTSGSNLCAREFSGGYVSQFDSARRRGGVANTPSSAPGGRTAVLRPPPRFTVLENWGGGPTLVIPYNLATPSLSTPGEGRMERTQGWTCDHTDKTRSHSVGPKDGTEWGEHFLPVRPGGIPGTMARRRAGQGLVSSLSGVRGGAHHLKPP